MISTNELHRLTNVGTLEDMANKIINNFRQKSLQASIATINSLYEQYVSIRLVS